MILNNYIKYLSVFVVIVLSLSIVHAQDYKSTIKKEGLANCDCDSLWQKSVARDFISILEKTTRSNYSVWKNYNLNTGVYILNAGQTTDGIHCLGLWKKGKAVSYKCSKDAPKMLTPLYSYYLNYKDVIDRDSKLFETYKNAPDFSSWMEANTIETAIYMPTDFPNFPFEIPAAIKTQLAVHEAFHVEVMLRYWYTSNGLWPKWDKQPDRTAVQSCYSENENIAKLIDQEQEILALTIEALLDDNKSKAISNANTFIKKREERYVNLLGKEIKLDNNKYGNCRLGEAFMEIEEGIADYASWVAMYTTGIVTREALLKRYRAKQKDRFYLTGCMLLHAAVLMNKGKDQEIIAKMVNAPSIDEGSLLKIFKEQLEVYKSKN